MPNTFVTADTHFYHKNISAYCGRPFNNVYEMNDELITRWNNVVGPDDTVYHLGDVGLFSKISQLDSILVQLNGKIFIVPGSHDKELVKWVGRNPLHWKGVTILPPVHTIHYNQEHIILSHCPFEHWERSHHGSIHLHGHCHSTCRKLNRRLDVGVDCHNLTPLMLEVAIELAKSTETEKFRC